ncbi:hypothetical protein QBC42DRAFT_320240 [Cladorrhinum samala]|uniref:WD40 repeat-like protein n=1 Tax=Cladorrhinum samala TaxID=585594 RepID=A0AAV9HAS0_9PEZI|nr:hypothetical protein QBC42DRAFT_320240 [Cladorrhinum samala]
MDSYASTYSTADGLDEMVDKLNRLDTRGSRHTHRVSSIDEQFEAYDPILGSGHTLTPVPRMPGADWYPGDDEAYRPKSRGKPTLVRRNSQTSERRPSRGSNAGYSLYPAARPPIPTKPLPSIPTLPVHAQDRRVSRQASFNGSVTSGDSSRYSISSKGAASLERTTSNGCSSPTGTIHYSSMGRPPLTDEERAMLGSERPRAASLIQVFPWKSLSSTDKPAKDPSVYFFDISTTAATLASKHGNNIIKIWSVGSGEVQSQLKISCYTTAQSRSREYFVRSHAILSEPTNMIAIATGFGDSLEIWDWGKKKRLQTIDNTDRWASVRSNVMESNWAPLITYRGNDDKLDLWRTSTGRKPFKLLRTLDLRTADLPVVPKYPELAFSATGPLLVTASGPRPPRLGHPPPEHETLLVAWEIHDGAPSTPYKIVTPWQHSELDTALPSGLATYGSVAVSIWIPASYRAVPVPAARGGSGYNLAPVAVPFRYVLVWDFAASSTKTFRIPNTMSCVSPDCRLLAYCDSRGVDSGARGCLAVLDALTGKQLWCWPDPDATAAEVANIGFDQLANLNKVTEMCFSADGGFLFIGDSEGKVGVFEVREGSGTGLVSLHPVSSNR